MSNFSWHIRCVLSKLKEVTRRLNPLEAQGVIHVGDKTICAYLNRRVALGTFSAILGGYFNIVTKVASLCHGEGIIVKKYLLCSSRGAIFVLVYFFNDRDGHIVCDSVSTSLRVFGCGAEPTCVVLVHLGQTKFLFGGQLCALVEFELHNCLLLLREGEEDVFNIHDFNFDSRVGKLALLYCLNGFGSF